MNIMDYDSFLEEMDQDLDVVNMIIDEFIKSINNQLPLMEELYINRDYNTLNREAHSIKGGARNLMAKSLELTSKDLEFAAADHDNLLIEQYLAQIKKDVEMFNNFITAKL
ncbi:MAG: Hpt domain-containing protein [Spirochaetaceae bacterium]